MKRVITAVVLIPPVLYLIFAAPSAAAVAAVVLVAGLCFHEYAGLLRGYGVEGVGPAAYAAGLLILLVPNAGTGLIVGIALAFFALALRRESVRLILPRAALVTFGILYIFGAWRAGIELRYLSPHWLLFALVINWVGDTAAYYAGRKFGRRQLAPVLSPKKTWEGAVASTVAAVAFGAAYLSRFGPAVPLWEILALSAAASLAGQVGDLAESAIKRGAGVKDSGRWLPGHGGWLDRLDGCLFSMPVIYLWVARPWITR